MLNCGTTPDACSLRASGEGQRAEARMLVSDFDVVTVLRAAADLTLMQPLVFWPTVRFGNFSEPTGFRIARCGVVEPQNLLGGSRSGGKVSPTVTAIKSAS